MQDRTIIGLSPTGSVSPGVRLNGAYQIESLIAVGGMGEVYKGFNIQTHDPVAIKMVLPELARNPETFALFRREASTLLTLRHEAIVRYFGFAVDPDLQRAYLTMEFVDGPSLTTRLRKGPLTLAELGVLRRRIAGALEASHRSGVIHRDISPDNIILPGDDPARATIIDFGIARSGFHGEGTLIGAGFAGKFNYVAPEQLGLAGGEVTARTDIYSLGLVLAEALRGSPIDMNGTQVEIIEKRRSVPDLSGLDASMVPLLRAMLQPLPADRPASMAAVAAWGENDGAAARPASAGRGGERDRGGRDGGAQPEAASSTGRLAAALGAILIVASVAGAFFFLRDQTPGNGPPGQAQAPRPDAAGTSTASIDAGSAHKLPPLPDPRAQPDHATGAAQTAEASPTPQSAPEIVPPAAQPAPHVPNADEIVASLDRAKQQRAEAAAANPAPAADDHAGAEAAKPAPPAPAPDKPDAPPAVAAPAPKPALSVAALEPPHAPQAALSMADAMVGRDYRADLPPFGDSAGAKSLVLRVEPGLPEGLAFADLGSGFARISGRPQRPGQYAFDIVASNGAAGAARMTARIVVAPAPAIAAPAPTDAPQPSAPAPASAAAETPNAPLARATSFVRDYDGGACFFARLLGATSDSIAIQGIGADRATFERFYGAFIHEIGAEPALTVRLIGSAQCPAVDLIRAAGGGRADAPKIELAGYDVGRGKPLKGKVVNLAGRRLTLLLVSNEGRVYRLDSVDQPGGDSAVFDIPMTADSAAADVPQVLLALAPPKPPAALDGFKAGPAADILPRLRNQLPDSGALDVEFFKMVR